MDNENGRLLHDDLALIASLTARRGIDENGCWQWLGARTTAGYGVIWWDNEPKYVHRMAAELFLGLDPSSKLYVLHRCDNRSCFNHEHLWLGTHADNMHDAVLKGRMGKRLTPNKVRELKVLLSEGRPRAEIAREFGVSRETIGDIARGETWKHVPWPEPRGDG